MSKKRFGKKPKKLVSVTVIQPKSSGKRIKFLGHSIFLKNFDYHLLFYFLHSLCLYYQKTASPMKRFSMLSKLYGN